APVAEERVLRSDAGVVEPCRYRVRVEDLPVLVGEERRTRSVEDAGPPRPEARGPGGLDPYEPNVRVVDEAGEHPDRIRAAADTGHDGVGQPPLRLQDLGTRLAPDHRLQLPHDRRVRMRSDAGADQVVRRLDVRDPVANRLADRLFQRPRAEFDAPDLGAEEVHPL